MSAATSDGSRGQILDRAAAEAVAASLRVLGDATRLQLLELLARSDHPMTVRELTKAIGLAQSTVSFHLARLADAQLVLVERTGRTSPYRLNPDALAGRHGERPQRRATRATSLAHADASGFDGGLASGCLTGVRRLARSRAWRPGTAQPG